MKGGGCSPPVLDGDSGHFALNVLGKKLIHVIYISNAIL